MHTPEAGTNRLTPCPMCGRQLIFAASAKLPPNVGDSDFDCYLVVEEQSSPARTYLLGGSADLAIGDSPDCTIRLIDDMNDGTLALLRRSGQKPSEWQIFPMAAAGTIQGLALRPAKLTHGSVISFPHVCLRYFTHPIATSSLAGNLALPTIPIGPAILAAIAFLLAIGAGAVRTLVPLSSRDGRMLLMLAVIFIVAPSFWLAALIWGLTRMRTAPAVLTWIGLLVLLALVAILVRVSIGLL